MWGNSEFGIQNSERFKYWRFFSQEFLAFSEKLGIQRLDFSLQKELLEKEYEKS